MANRLVVTYALLGPATGALLYVALSAIAARAQVFPELFLDPGLFGPTFRGNLGLASWQIACSAPLTVMPALLTGLLTVRRIRKRGSCPWWLSCGYGGLASGALALPGLGFGHLLVGELIRIPPVIAGSALIALIGFVGTLPCWWLVSQQAKAYRSSPQNL